MRDPKGHRRHHAQPGVKAVTSGRAMGEFEPVRVPNHEYGRERRCARGERCVCQPAALLSIYNPGPNCYCCDVAVRRERKAELQEAPEPVEPVEGTLSQEIADIEDRMGVAA